MLRARAAVLLVAGVLALLPSGTVHAAGRVVHATPTTYQSALAALKPGETLQLAPGEYRDGLRLHRMVATPHSPIVIRGPEGAEPAIFVARPGANTVSILDSAYIHIRDITLDGGGLAVDAVKAEGHANWAHHITLENLTIVNHGIDQQIVGISTKCPAWGWIIRGNRIHGAGTGMYLGNSDGSAPFFSGLIEHNLITDPLGYAIQIKHQRDRPTLPLAPSGPQTTIIRHNVLSKAMGGSPHPFARPNLLLGHWPLDGPGARDEYLVYGNVLVDNPLEALFQGEGNIAFYNNVLRNRHGPGVHIQPHNDVPRNVRIFHNTIITSGDPIVIRNREGLIAYRQVVSGNAVFSPRRITGGVQEHNLVFAYEQAGALLGSMDDPMFDPYPRDERLRCPSPEAGLLHDLVDAQCDFNGRRRARSYCGAYAGEGRNPGWLPALQIKPSAACPLR